MSVSQQLQFLLLTQEQEREREKEKKGRKKGRKEIVTSITCFLWNIFRFYFDTSRKRRDPVVSFCVAVTRFCAVTTWRWSSSLLAP